jgi:serine/threonine protein kinase
MSFEISVLVAVVALVALLAILVIITRRRRKSAPGRKVRGPAASMGAAMVPDKGVRTGRRNLEGAVSSPAPAPTHTPYLLARTGPLRQRRFSIPPGGLAIGRHPENQVCLTGEPLVSRHHAIIVSENDRHVLYDRDSANGTWVNDQRVFRHTLAPGDCIQIWQSEFVYDPITSAPASAPPDLPSGRREGQSVAPAPLLVTAGTFSGYQLEHLIGRGGMSEVWKAHDAAGHQVAIKILQHADPYLVDKFIQEGNKIGPLLRGHENIVYIHEFGRSGEPGAERLYIVMEYVDAPSLRKRLAQQPDEAETVQIIGQVCSALAYAHDHDVVHRDIKPENILVTAEGVAKVLDFGIAKLTSAATVTRDKIVGTPEYISPEQARGDRVVPASDVYSVGVVLYEMLTGTVPFPRPADLDAWRGSLEVVHHHLESRPEPIRKRCPGAAVSRHVERATMRALKKHSRDRYTSARELGDALGYQPTARADVGTVHRAVREPPLPDPHPNRAEATLHILHGPRQGEVIILDGRTVTLGRYALRSTNRTISRSHATIFFRGTTSPTGVGREPAGSYWLKDTSTNGTWVDDVRIYGEVPLQPGATIAIGDNILRFEPDLG